MDKNEWIIKKQQLMAFISTSMAYKNILEQLAYKVSKNC